MNKEKTLIHLEVIDGIKHGKDTPTQIRSEISGEGREIIYMLSVFFVSKPDTVDLFLKAIEFSQITLKRHEKGEIDLTKVIKSIEFQKGKN